MRIIYMTMGRYGIMCTVNAKTEDEATEALKDALTSLKEQVTIESVGSTETSTPYAYACKRIDSLSFPYTCNDVNLIQESVQLNLPGVNQAVSIDCGVGVFLASTGWGKTTYMVRGLYPAIVNQYGTDGVELVSWGEPFEDFGDVKSRIIFRAIDLLKEMCLFVNSSRPVLMIDSFRPFLYDQSVGTTGERGIDAFLPVQLTALSNTLAVCGKLLFATLNPMIDATTDQELERYERLQGSIEASVPFVLTGTSHRSAVLSLRGLNNPNRDPKYINIPDLTFNAGARTSEDSEIEMTVSLSPEDEPISLPSTDVKRFMNTINR